MEENESQKILFENQFQITENFMKKYGKELGRIWKRRDVFLYSIMIFGFMLSILYFLSFLNSDRKEVLHLIFSFLFLLLLIPIGIESSIINISRGLKKRLKEEANNYPNVLERHYIFRQESIEFSNGIRLDYSLIREVKVSENFIVLIFRYPLGLVALIKKDAFSIGTTDSLLNFMSNRKNTK